MGLFNSPGDEPDGYGAIRLPWWWAALFVVLSVVWGLFAFLGAPSPVNRSILGERPEEASSLPPPNDPTQEPLETAKDLPVQPETSLPEVPAGSEPAPDSLASAAPTAAEAPAVATHGDLAPIPPETAQELPVRRRAPVSPPETRGGEPVPKSLSGPAPTVPLTSPLPPRRSPAEKARSKLANVIAPAEQKAGLWPPNDPDFKNCVRAARGVTLKWQSTDPTKSAYLMVKSRHNNGEWATWIEKKPVHGAAFTLTMRGDQARNSQFQWMLSQSPTSAAPTPNYF